MKSFSGRNRAYNNRSRRALVAFSDNASRAARQRSLVLGAAAASCLLYTMDLAQATTYSYTSGSSSSAATAANYTPTLPSGGPGTNDTLLYAGQTSSTTLTFTNVSWSFGNIIYSNTANGTFNNSSTVGSTILTLNGDGVAGDPLINVTTADRLAILGTAASTGKILSLNFATSGTLNIGSGGTLGLGATLTDSAVGGTRLTKTGAGTLDLGYSALTNGLVGGITVSAGDVRFFNPSQFGVAPSTPVSNYITLDGGTLTFSSTLGNTAVANEGINITANNGTFEQAAATSTYIENAVISGSGMLTKVGAGSLTLSGANTFSGGFTISAGIVNFSTAANLGDPAGVLTINSGELRDTATSNISLESTRAITLGASGGTFDVAGGSGTTLSVPSTISGTGALTKNGAGTLYLDNSGNTFAGGVIVNNGTVEFFNKAALGTVPAAGVANYFQLNNASLSFNTSVGDAQSSRQGFAITGVDGIDVPASSVNYTIAGTISGAGMLVKTGAGTLSPTANNNYTGGTVIAGGTINVATGPAVGSSGAVNPITLSGGALNFNNSFTALAFSGNRPIYIGTASAGVGTIGVSPTFSARLAGAILNSSLGGVGSLVKANTGTLILEGSSSFTGGTNVLAGTLIASNTSSALGSGAVAVGDGTNAATLGGNGLIAGNITFNNASTLAPGAFTTASYNVGTLTSGGSLTLHSGTTVVEKIASDTSNDVTSLTNGTVAFDSAISSVTLSLVAVGGYMPSGGRYNFINFPVADTPINFTPTTPSSAGTFVIDPASAVAAGFDISNASVGYDNTLGDIYLSGIQSVPEPMVSACVVLSTIPLLRRRRTSIASV